MGSRETKALISLRAILNNYQQIKNQSGKHVLTVLKANAYGHGDIEVAKALENYDKQLMCVSSLDEAIHLRENGVQSEILIFSYVNPCSIHKLEENSFIYTIPNMEWIKEIERLNLKLRLHLEINLGMNRYGLQDINDIKTIASNHKLEGIYFHFQDSKHSKHNIETLKKFKDIVDSLDTKPKCIHVGNASLDLVKNESWINGFRSGLGIYGFREDIKGLVPALTITTKLTHKVFLHKGETVGYDFDYIVPEDGWYGTIPIGYADGFNMDNAHLPVIIGGKEYPIVGKICMDQTMIRIDDTVSFYQDVEILSENRNLKKISAATNRSIYNLLTDISPRIERVYHD